MKTRRLIIILLAAAASVYSARLFVVGSLKKKDSLHSLINSGVLELPIVPPGKEGFNVRSLPGDIILLHIQDTPTKRMVPLPSGLLGPVRLVPRRVSHTR